MARRLHVLMPECAVRKEGTMSREMIAACQSKIEEVAHAEVASSASQSYRSVPFVELRNILPSHIDIISPFVDQLIRFISRFREPGENTFDIELALREALANAIVHGNQQDIRKSVYVKCRCTADGEVSITVKDEGTGFENDVVPDPTSPDNLLLTHGRGIYLLKTLMDEVHFEQGGSVVHMRKRANTSSDATRKPQ